MRAGRAQGSNPPMMDNENLREYQRQEEPLINVRFSLNTSGPGITPKGNHDAEEDGRAHTSGNTEGMVQTRSRHAGVRRRLGGNHPRRLSMAARSQGALNDSRYSQSNQPRRILSTAGKTPNTIPAA